MVTLRERIRGEIGAELGRRAMSQRELARRLNWSQTYLSMRLRGKYDFTVIELQAIAVALGVPLSALIPTDDTPAEVTA